MTFLMLLGIQQHDGGLSALIAQEPHKQKRTAKTTVPAKVGQILKERCMDCHSGQDAASNVRFDQLNDLNRKEQTVLFNQMQNQVFFNLMPPPEEVALEKREQQVLASWLGEVLHSWNASELEKKKRYPNYGNYVDHDELFNREQNEAAYTASRRWLISPALFEERVTQVFALEGRELDQARQNGFYGVTNPFVLPDHSGVRDYDVSALNGGHLLIMLDNAKWIAEKQLVAAQIKKGTLDPKSLPNPKDRWYPRVTPEEFERILLTDSTPTESDIHLAIEKQFQLVLRRSPTQSETKKYLQLAQDAISYGGNTNGLKQLLIAVLLESEFLYRVELGSGEKDKYGRYRLSSHEASFAISYALGDRGPDTALLTAAARGKLLTREDYKREVTRLLDDDNYFRGAIGHSWGSRDKIPPRITSHPKLVRFFREFFGYPAALKVFKDLKRSGGFYLNPGRGSNQTPGHLVNEADRVVAGIVEADKDVFNQLLTTDRFFLYHNRDNETGATLISNWKIAYEALKNTNWREDPDGVVLANEELIKKYLDPRGITGRSKARHDNSLIRFMTHFEHTFGKGNRPFTTMPWAHGNHYWHSPIYSLPRTPRSPNYGNQDDLDYEPVQPYPMPNRKGILTHPAWLVAHSGNFATDPIRRGKWIREKLLAGKVPDLPITVDAQVPENPHQTFRERVESVTSDSACWKCHRKMNPLGMPFEHFDDFGRFRLEESLEYEENILKRMPGNETDLYKTKPIDTRGSLEGTGDPELDGQVDDSFDLIDRLAQSDRVRQSIIRHAFRFFMGRNELISDSKTLREADQAYLDSGGSFRAVVISLLCSDSFRFRKPEPDKKIMVTAKTNAQKN